MVWVEYPDIAPLAEKIGAPPCGNKPDGSPNYAVPILYDPTVDTHLTNSLDIALYLDQTHPGDVPLFPPGTEALIRAWDDLWMQKAGIPLYQLLLADICAQLNPPSQAYFRATREAKFGSLKPPQDAWSKLEVGLGAIDAYMGQARFVAGERVTYADMIMAGWFIFARRVWGKDSEAWERVEGWHDGRWKRLLEDFADFEYVGACP